MLEKVTHKIKKIRFYLAYGRFFKKFPLSSMVLSVLKIQGREFISMDENVYVHRFVWLGVYKIDEHTPELHIGKGSCIGNFNHFTCVRKLTIGQNVLTADKVYISDNTHSFEDVTTPILQQQTRFKKEVVIDDGAWIGENVCIIGASVGKNSVVGANSVVTKDIPDFCLAVGNPAKVIKQYNFDTQLWEKV